MRAQPLLIFLFAGLSTIVRAADLLGLQSFEPNTVTWVKDSNDVNYLDFKFSLMYPLTPNNTFGNSKNDRWSQLNFYFAVNARLAQYIETRDSSPVIGKQFAPRLFNRFWLNEGEYIDFGYVHESNGQAIDDADEYIEMREHFAENGENPDFANDYISRGWDYWELRSRFRPLNKLPSLATYLMLKHYLDNGGLQGKPEEIRDFERTPSTRLLSRQAVDGLSLLAKYNVACTSKTWCINKWAAAYTTGIARPFDYSSLRVELTVSVYALPFTIWYAYGYQSDLIDYDKQVESIGIGFEFTTK